MKRIAIACGFVLGSAVLAGAVRAQSPEETKASVPALTAFHDVIYPMWHTAWAERDTAMLRDLWPDVQKHVAAIQKAELPGILRDKKAEMSAIFCILPFLQQGQRVMSMWVSRSMISWREWVAVRTAEGHLSKRWMRLKWAVRSRLARKP